MKNEYGYWTETRLNELADKLYEYIETAEPYPSLINFAHKNDILRSFLYKLGEKNERLGDAIKSCTERKEEIIEAGALTKKFDSHISRFSLHQLGWKSEKTIEHKGEVTVNQTKIIVNGEEIK